MEVLKARDTRAPSCFIAISRCRPATRTAFCWFLLKRTVIGVCNPICMIEAFNSRSFLSLTGRRGPAMRMASTFTVERKTERRTRSAQPGQSQTLEAALDSTS